MIFRPLVAILPERWCYVQGCTINHNPSLDNTYSINPKGPLQDLAIVTSLSKPLIAIKYLSNRKIL